MTQATPKIVRSIDTRKPYRVLREYKTKLLVAPAWKKNGLPFTIDRADVEA